MLMITTFRFKEVCLLMTHKPYPSEDGNPIHHRSIRETDMPSETDTRERIRVYGFYVAVVGTIAVVGVSLSPFLPHVIVGWSGSLGDRSIFGLVTMAGAWTALFGMAVQFYRPTERVNAILLLPFVTLLSGVIGVATGTVFATVTLVVAAIAIIPLVLHPAGRSVVRFDPVAAPSRVLVGLYAVGGIFLVIIAGQELINQFTLTGEDALRGHYGDLAIWAFSIAMWGGLAVFRRRDWRFAAWVSGFVGLYLGVGSAVFPDASSSLGLIGGVSVAAWAVAFVVMAERTRGRLRHGGGAIEESATR